MGAGGNKRRSESFVVIPGYEDYVIYDDGKIFSNNIGDFIRPWTLRNGYVQVHLRDRYHKRKAFTVHRLVMMSFVGDSNLQVNHKNGIKSDNRLENLEYCTASENIKHSYNSLDRKGPTYWKGKFGIEAPRSKAVIGTRISDGESIRFDSIRMALGYFGRTTGTISIALNGRTKKAYGFTWKYE